MYKKLLCYLAMLREGCIGCTKLFQKYINLKKRITLKEMPALLQRSALRHTLVATLLFLSVEAPEAFYFAVWGFEKVVYYLIELVFVINGCRVAGGRQNP